MVNIDWELVCDVPEEAKQYIHLEDSNAPVPEVEAVLPWSISSDDVGLYSLDYDNRVKLADEVVDEIEFRLTHPEYVDSLIFSRWDGSWLAVDIKMPDFINELDYIEPDFEDIHDAIVQGQFEGTSMQRLESYISCEADKYPLLDIAEDAKEDFYWSDTKILNKISDSLNHYNKTAGRIQMTDADFEKDMDSLGIDMNREKQIQNDAEKARNESLSLRDRCDKFADAVLRKISTIPVLSEHHRLVKWAKKNDIPMDEVERDMDSLKQTAEPFTYGKDKEIRYFDVRHLSPWFKDPQRRSMNASWKGLIAVPEQLVKDYVECERKNDLRGMYNARNIFNFMTGHEVGHSTDMNYHFWNRDKLFVQYLNEVHADLYSLKNVYERDVKRAADAIDCLIWTSDDLNMKDTEYHPSFPHRKEFVEKNRFNEETVREVAKMTGCTDEKLIKKAIEHYKGEFFGDVRENVLTQTRKGDAEKKKMKKHHSMAR